MRTRLDLDGVLREIMQNGNVYFQPNENVRMKYPCIVYNLYDIENGHGDNIPYLQNAAYQLTLIDPNPDNKYWEKISQLPWCSIDRTFVADNLNHYVYTIYI